MNTHNAGDLESSSTSQNQASSIFARNNETSRYPDAASFGTSGECPDKGVPPRFETQRIIRMRIRRKVTVFDVAAYIIDKIGPLSAMKLQKLVYYCQAWSLVWDESPLFPERIEAWSNGPVIPVLFSFHRGQFTVDEIAIGNIDNLNSKQKETIDAVLEFYGNKPAQWLIDLSHSEKPWQSTRRGLPETESSNREISIEIIAEYYSSLGK
jgi:uncharacterized phage-associated protein